MATGKITSLNGARGLIADDAITNSATRPELWAAFTVPPNASFAAGDSVEFRYDLAAAKMKALRAMEVRPAGQVLADEQTTIRVQGTVAKFVAERGFGFIRASGRDYFFHITDVEGGKELPIDADVTFLRDDRGGKIKARDVRAA